MIASCFLNQIRIIAGTKTNKRETLCFHKITANVYPIVIKMKKKILVKFVKYKLSFNKNPIMPETSTFENTKEREKLEITQLSTTVTLDIKF